jgi:type IX secretion system PorP/SprF family membrane protein
VPEASDRAGAGDLTSSTVKLQYAYSLNMTKNLSFRPGVQMSYVQRTIDYDKIVFGDQLEFDVNKPSSMEPSLYQKVNYMDFSASLLTIYKKYWFGFTYDHITKPNQSLLNESSEVPLRLIAYAGAKVSVKSKFNKKRTRENMYFMVHYNQQGTAKQAYLGSYWEHNETLLGVWYRGVPFLKSYETNVNTDALILMLGFKRGNFSFLYSYDFTISKLVSKTSGSQEVTITWNWKNAESEKNKKHRMNVVPCPMSDGPRYKYHTQNSM